MGSLKAFGAFVALSFILLLSFLLVVLNPEEVSLDLFGLFFIEQALGLLILFAFVLGILFSLALVFIPSQIMVWRNKRLNKKLEQD